ncbi:MAG: MarR family transcriptional regulator [Planctomycetes bacterium]|nr:MarR family transcriptional regulator [Planctomycetota bacterium]
MKQNANLLQDLMLLNRASQLVLQERAVEKAGARRVNPAKLNVLRLLRRRHEQTVNDLARSLGYTKAAASQNVEHLMRGGLVRRRTDESDRRCAWISLTARGRRMLARLEKIQTQSLARALKGLSKSSEQHLARGMRELALTLLRDCGAQPASCLQCCTCNSAACIHRGGGWLCRYAAVFHPADAQHRAANSPPARGTRAPRGADLETGTRTRPRKLAPAGETARRRKARR